MTRRARWLWLLGAVGGVLLFVYAAMPLAAGYRGVGNRWGPKIYPIWYHEGLYIISWELAGHAAKKPRMAWDANPDDRPWFYDWSTAEVTDREDAFLRDP